MDSETGECRRLAPVQTTGFARPWPVTGTADWCHLFAPVGAIPGGRGNRLTNQEIVAHVSDQEGIEAQKLIEQLQTSGLPEPIALKRIDRLIELGLLVDREGTYQPGDGKPLPKKKDAGAEEPVGEPSPSEEPAEKISAPRAPKRRHSLDPFLPRLRMIATPDQPAGFNEMFTAATDIQMIGKGTFSKLIGEALAESKILRYEAGKFSGKYYFDVEIDPP
jgi:hypothetical protein